MRWAWVRSGIYRRFITAMAALAVVPLAFLGISLVNISEKGIQASVLELHTKMAEKLAEGVQTYLKTVDESILFALNAAQKSNLAWPEKQDLLRTLLESYPDLEELSVVSQQGREILKIYNPASGATGKLSDRTADPAFVQYVHAKQRALWLSPGADEAPQMEIYYPLPNNLALRASLRLRTLWASIGSERVGGTGFAFVVDREGKPLIYPPDRLPPNFRDRIPKLTIVRQALQANSIGSTEYTDAGGWTQVGAYAPVPEFEGAVIIQQQKTEAYMAAYRMKQAALFVIVLFGGLAILLAVLMARRLTRPVLAITRAAADVAEGRFPAAVDVDTGDELQNLALTFNNMVAQLRKYSEIQVDRLLREQQKTESILFSIEDGILMTDDSGRVQLANRRAREILGLTAATPLDGKTLEEIVPAGPLRNLVLHMAEHPGEGLLRELDLSHDTVRRFIRVSAQPVVMPTTGVKIGVVTALRDVTLEKQLDKMKEEFLQSITHDLRNPVSSIIGFAEFLLKGVVGVLQTEQRDMVLSVQSAAGRLLAMVNNILDAAKMETGRIDLKLKSLSLAGVGGHVIDMLGALAQRRGISLDLDAEQEFMIVADPDLIERVFTNLVGNAIKFAADDGHVTVHVTDAGDCLKACVEDDGIGIPEAYREKIFEKFEQIPGQRKGGTGLGLTICRHIVEAHLGRIWVESEPGHGARFFFTIPKGLTVLPDGRVICRDAPEAHATAEA